MKFPQANIFKHSTISRVSSFLLCVLTLASSSFGQIAADDQSGKESRDNLSPSTVFLPNGTTCADLNASTESRFSHIKSNFELRLDFEPPNTSANYPYTPRTTDPKRTLVGPSDSANSVTTVHDNGSLNWTSTKPVTALIIRPTGTGNSSVYWYNPNGTLGDNNNSVQFPDSQKIKSVGFCYFTPATVTVIKEATAIGGGTSTSIAFPFTSTPNFGVSSFSLVDNNSGVTDRRTNANIYGFGTGNAITVTENIVQGWTLSDLACVSTAGTVAGFTFPNTNNNTITFAERKARIVLEEAERVVCTYKNLQLVPSAGEATVSGRAVRADGRGLNGAMLTLLNVNTGETSVARTNQFGYYSFTDLPVSEFYVLTIEHKRHHFLENTRSFTLNDEIASLDFYEAF